MIWAVLGYYLFAFALLAAVSYFTARKAVRRMERRDDLNS